MEKLWRTHRVFNERLPAVIGILFKMRRGECGSTPQEQGLYRRVGYFITGCSSQNAEYLMNSISIRGWKSGAAKKCKAAVPDGQGKLVEITGETWADEAAALSADGQLLFEKGALHGDLPGCLRQMLCRESVAIISGHDELLRLWHCEHEQWLARKQDWEGDSEHRLYLGLRPRFEQFEREVGGKTSKRRGRWHLYFAWLKENPDLAAWRGRAPIGVKELDAAAKDKVHRAKPWKQRSLEAEEFWKVNPELRELDRLHGFYEKEFVRRRKTKRNPDGFEHRPTFTLPDAVRHPRWFVFNAPQTSPQGYRNLHIPEKAGAVGDIELQLLTGDPIEQAYPVDWVGVRFKSDPRLCDLRSTKVSGKVHRGKDKGTFKEKDGFIFHDRQLGIDRPAELKGAKLIFDLGPDHSPVAAYIVFTLDVKDCPITESAKGITFSDGTEVTAKGKPRKTRKLPAALVSLAVDLGCRNLGFATLARYDNSDKTIVLLRSRNIWLEQIEAGGAHPGRVSAGPGLGHLARHKREIRRLRGKRGKPIKGESSHVRLQEHIDGMAEDRFKKAARAIINLALNVDVEGGQRGPYPRADVLILESLGGLIPDAERERGINRSLIEFNRGNLVKRIREQARDVGLKVFEISPVGTSQVCCKCGFLGRRYSIGHEGGEASILFGAVEKLFACGQCGYRANADHNASVNLQRRFYLGDTAVESYTVHRKKSEPERRAEIEAIERSLRPSLRQLHGIGGMKELRDLF